MNKKDYEVKLQEEKDKLIEQYEVKLQEEKDKLIMDYEFKFDKFKEELTSKFSNFVDEILDEKMVIPDKVIEYARKGELYSDLIEQFKVRLGVDEGLLDDEVKALLKEAKNEIINLTKELDKKTGQYLEVQSDAQSMAAELYLIKKCDGLDKEKAKFILTMLEGIKDIEEIDRKFDYMIKRFDSEEDEK